MFTRREFVKQAALLSGAAGLSGALPASIQRALAIDPQPGSTVLDAEHVVILMQENRSFDHSFGTLQGVRGFNDPRAITLPDNNPVWVQTNDAGESYVPFRLNMKDTSATWMGSLPHSWSDQVDARNQGKYDRWLQAKRSGDESYAKMPLTMGYYNREDIPFYYALADAFTVCDQNFCSSLTGTTPNRLHLWTGTIRAKQSADSPANVSNSDVEYTSEASWTTFPERLEDHGISWKIYQNELSLEMGFEGDEEGWLSNFTDNPIEWFTQFNVRFSPAHRAYVEKRLPRLPAEIQALETKIAAHSGNARELIQLKKQLHELTGTLKRFTEERVRFSRANWEKLSPREKNLHAKAFCTNVGDPDYHKLAELKYRDGDKERTVQVPKGDLFHQFRQDVASGNLPTVSWLVAPQKLSDHPSSAWYGAWYVSEVLDILTHNPEVWKKTVFILNYDENDGYFDHVPPFVAPHPRKPETGRVSQGIDAALEFVELEQDRKQRSADEARESPIGLGYRVPMLIASPWSRGGCVCSQVFDHTSVLLFLEKLLAHKTGTKIEDANINQWRRAVCGDLTSAFEPYQGETIASPTFLDRDEFVEEIHRAQFKKLPTGFKQLTKAEIEQIRQASDALPSMPRQEPGVRRACALPYQLAVDGKLNDDKTQFAISFAAGNDVFGERSAGSPFVVYAHLPRGDVKTRNYAVAAGDRLQDAWPIRDFDGGAYHLRVYGPNGFFREFHGGPDDPAVDIQLIYSRAKSNDRALSGNVEIKLVNRDSSNTLTVEIRDNSYKTGEQKQTLAPGATATVAIATQRSSGWYDLSVHMERNKGFEKRYAGHVETGKWTSTDPAMGRAVT